MEEKFYLDDFELSLQEQVNQFKMVPTKKVWHGVYNDLHPGRRWPSVVVSLVLIFSIVFIGYINNHTDKNVADIAAQKLPSNPGKAISKPGIASEKLAANSIEEKDDHNIKQEEATTSVNVVLPATELSEKINETDNGTSTNESGKTSILYPDVKQEIKPDYSLSPNLNITKGQNNYPTEKNNIVAVNKMPKGNFMEDNNTESINNTPVISFYTKGTGVTLEQNSFKNSHIKIPGLVDLNEGSKKIKFLQVNDHINVQSNLGESSNAALAIARKRNDKISWVYYAAPFISSVTFSGSTIKENTNSNLSSSPLPQVTQKDMKVIRNAAFGFEAGVQMNYSFAPKLQLTTGAHITRSGYNIVSNLVHPTLATLTLKNPSNGDVYSRSFVTHYGDGTGISTVTLRNYSYQASIPVGVQYLMWDMGKFQVNLAGSFEPSLIFKADAYILAADGKNYVNVPDLLRKWNFSSNFAPFISFKSNKLKWNIGPNIRYQWLSTYQNNYTVKEHLIDYGLRVGISK